MQITDVRVRKLSEEGKMRGIVSVTFDNAFVVHDIKIIEGQNGLFIVQILVLVREFLAVQFSLPVVGPDGGGSGAVQD